MSHNSSWRKRRRQPARKLRNDQFVELHRLYARRTPDRPALKYRGEEISYAVFDARIRNVAGWLAAQGIGAGDVVAVLMKNSAAFLELVFATSHLGAVFLPINFRLSRDEGRLHCRQCRRAAVDHR